MHSYNPGRLNRWIYKCKTKVPLSHGMAISELNLKLSALKLLIHKWIEVISPRSAREGD